METLPGSTRKPGSYIGFDTRRANNSLPANLQKVLIIAQRLAAGAVAELIPTRIYSDKEAAAAFGAGSPAHLMAKKAIINNPLIDLTVITQADAGGSAAAAGTFTFTGTATGPGVCSAYVGDVLVEFAVADGDTAAEIATALDAALDARVADLPVTSAANVAVVTATAKNKGTFGNGIKLAATITAPGTTVAVVAMANGAVDPDIAGALAVVYATRYHIIVSQYADATNLGKLMTHVEEVSGKIEQRGARTYYSITGALGSATSLAGDLNSGRMRLPYLRGTYTHGAVFAAAFAGYRAGVEDPAMPLNGDTLKGIHIPPAADLLSRAEQETCLHNGVTPCEVNNNRVQIVRAVTNYLVDSESNPDDSLLDESAIDTLDYTRDVVRAIPKPKKITTKTMARLRDLIYAALKRLERAEILTDVDLYQDRLIVEKYPDRVGWLRVTVPSPVVPGLHVLDGTIELYL